MEEKLQKRTEVLNRKKKLLLVVLLLLISALVTEIGARVIFATKAGPKVLLYGTSYYRFESTNKASNHTVMQHANEVAGYAKYFPNEQKVDHNPETGEVFRVNINSHGFRGKDFLLAKQPGTIRVVTLGASSTFGYYDQEDETYPYLLEVILNENPYGKSFEVINLGIPHLRSGQILALFQTEALPLKPDVVTFYEAANDSGQLMHDVVSKKESGKKAALRKKLASLSLVRSAYRALRSRLITLAFIDSYLKSEGVITYTKEYHEKNLEGKKERFVKNIAAINDVCKERGILFIVVKQLAKSKMVKNVKGLTYDEEIEIVKKKLESTNSITHTELAFLTHKVLTDGLDKWARSNGVAMVDVISLLDKDRDVLFSWIHLKPRGNRLIAQALSDKILELVD